MKFAIDVVRSDRTDVPAPTLPEKAFTSVLPEASVTEMLTA